MDETSVAASDDGVSSAAPAEQPPSAKVSKIEQPKRHSESPPGAEAAGRRATRHICLMHARRTDSAKPLMRLESDTPTCTHKAFTQASLPSNNLMYLLHTWRVQT